MLDNHSRMSNTHIQESQKKEDRENEGKKFSKDNLRISEL